MRKHILLPLAALLAALALVLPASAAGTTFRDVPENAWYYSAVESAANEYRLMEGYGDGLFGPDDALTREQFVKLLSSVAGADVSAYRNASLPFEDVPRNAWYRPYVAWAYETGVTSGTGPNTFGSGQAVTREQVAKFIVTFSELYNYPLTPSDASAVYSDGDQISSWAAESVERLRLTGLLQGDGQQRLNPGGRLTRAQAATIMVRWMAILEHGETDVYYLQAITADPSQSAVTVTACAGTRGNLLVEVLNEARTATLATGAAQVYTGGTARDVTVSLSGGTLPRYFVVRATLMDDKGNRLCDPLETIRYTSAYETFASKTVNDFGDAAVINLDDRPDNNFMVAAEGVQYLPEDAGCTVTPLEDGTYIIDVEDQTLFQPGRMILETEDEALLLDIQEIHYEGPYLRLIVNPDTKAEDFFQYIRIGADVAGSAASGRVQADLRGWELSISELSATNSFSVGDIGGTATIGGTPTLHVEVDFSPPILGDGYLYAEIWSKLEYRVTVELGVSGDTRGSGALDVIPAFVNMGMDDLPDKVNKYLNAYFKVSVALEMEGAADLKVTSGGTFKAGYLLDTRNQTCQVIRENTPNEPEVLFHMEASVSLGPRAILSAKFFDLFDGYIEFFSGVSAEAEKDVDLIMDPETAGEDKYHACRFCLDGELSALMRLTSKVEADAGFMQASFEDETEFVKSPLGDFFVSITNDPRSVHKGRQVFGFGACPNYLYRTVYQAQDGDGNYLSVPIQAPDKTGSTVTVSSGEATYLYPADYSASAVIDGETVTKHFTVSASSQTVVIKSLLQPLYVRVVDDKGKALDASIALSGEGEYTRKGTESLNGVTYTLYLVPEGSWKVTATKEKYTSASKTVDVSGRTTLTLTLKEAGWLQAYAEIIAKTYQAGSFTLAYIDDNDIPELVISNAPYHMASANIYTWYNGQLVDLGGMGDFGTTAFTTRQGVIRPTFFINGGWAYTNYCRLENGTSTRFREFVSDASLTKASTTVYTVDGSTVSKSSYDSQLSALNSQYQFYVFDSSKGWKPTQANINAMLEDYTKFFVTGG